MRKPIVVLSKSWQVIFKIVYGFMGTIVHVFCIEEDSREEGEETSNVDDENIQTVTDDTEEF